MNSPPDNTAVHPQSQHTNGFAQASIACGLLALILSFYISLFGDVAQLNAILIVLQLASLVLAVVFGHRAMSEIRKSDGVQAGSGLATAGLVIGYGALVVGMIGAFSYLLSWTMDLLFLDL